MDAAAEKYDKINCAAIILAAGQSTRLGKPKQLLKFKGKTLLQNAIDSARQAGLQPIITVLGSYTELVLSETDTKEAIIVRNDNWQTGMASSVMAGIVAIENDFPATEAAILMVCDQPYVDGMLLNELVSKHQNTGKSIIASQYDKVLGVPALFHRSLFKELIALKGDSGARKVIQKHADRVEVVLFPDGSIDIDTIGDYERLTQ